MWPEGVGLKHHCEAPALGRYRAPGIGDDLVSKADAAAVRGLESGDKPQECRFPAA
jgi:hypothetical protein